MDLWRKDGILKERKVYGDKRKKQSSVICYTQKKKFQKEKNHHAKLYWGQIRWEKNT